MAPFHYAEHVFDNEDMDGSMPQVGWSPGQKIIKDAGAASPSTAWTCQCR
jgi:hypothetical protein